jgi:crotonobetainyl-CoA:carnitine CoA-transferase CaiB-like acyl-CoA transferase
MLDRSALRGIRVLGAEVIKIEHPDGGDSLRRFGTPHDCGDSLVWLSEARNKKSITLDLRQPEGAAILKKLVARSHVFLENFRPGTLERWGLAPPTLLAVNPGLVILRVSGYGQTGPMAGRPGFARTAHAFGGLAYLAGEPGHPPVVPGSTSLADYLSGLFGAVGVLVALRHAERTGAGQCIDVALYECVFRILDELLPAFSRFGYQRERMGADTVNVVPHSHYPTRDGAWIAIACSNDRMWQRLAQAMGVPELGADSRYATARERNLRRAEVNALVASWTRSLDLRQLVAACESAEAPCSPILSISEIHANEHYRARGDFQTLADPRAGALEMPAPVPRLSVTPGELRSMGPELGSSNREIYEELLGLSREEITALQAKRVI